MIFLQILRLVTVHCT